MQTYEKQFNVVKEELKREKDKQMAIKKYLIEKDDELNRKNKEVR